MFYTALSEKSYKSCHWGSSLLFQKEHILSNLKVHIGTKYLYLKGTSFV